MERLARALAAHPRVRHAVAMWLNHMLVWHAACAFFALCDARAYFSRYKISRGRDRVSWRSVMPVVLRNQIFILLPAMVVLAYNEVAFALASHPWWLVVVHTQLVQLTHDTIFYFGHRLLHTRALYTLSGHALHHRSNGGTAAASMYMSAPDFCVEIVAPFLVHLALFDTDPRFDHLLAFAGTLSALYEHSGYCFTHWRVLDTRAHCSHHAARPHGSFSEGALSTGLWDWLLGTSWHQERASERAAQK